MTVFELQTIDLEGFAELLSQKDYEHDIVKRVLKQLQEAGTEQGFFYIKNHGIDQEIINELFSISKEYFKQPIEVKTKDFVAHNEGYSKFGQENLQMVIADFKESFNFKKDYATNHVLPPIIEKKRHVVDEFIKKSWKISRAIITGLSLVLGLEPEYLNQAHTNIGKSETLFRLLHYPPVNSDVNTENTIRAGSHSDFGTITLLIQEALTAEQIVSATGLQVLDKNKDSEGNDIWHNVPSKPGTIVVNIADLLSLWTEGRFISSVHRVIIPQSDIPKSHRYSIAHFIQPDASYKIYPLKSPIPAPHPAIEVSPGVQKASFGIGEFFYGDTGDTYFQRRTAETNY